MCKALTREYGLHFSKGKMNVKRDRLRGKDKVKYQIYDAVKTVLPHCNCWSDLCDRLAKQGIGVHFKLDRRNGNIVGVSFTKNEISFSGSRIDQSMSFYKLDRLFGSQIVESMEWKPRVQEQPQPTRQDVEFHNNTTDTFIREPSPTKAEADGNGSIPAESGSNIVQVTIGTLMELCVQPHQAKVSSGGGGGGNESGWGENDNEKDMRKRGVPTIKEQLDDIQKTLKDQVEKDRQASEQVRQKQGLIPGLWQAIRSDKAISSIRLLWSKFPMAGIRILMYGLA